MMLLANFDIKKSGLISALLLLVMSGLMAEKPVQDNFLFQVLRSRDADRIYYEVQIDSLGHLDANNPVNAYWVRYSRQQQTEPLTGIQRRFGYGLTFLQIEEKHATFQFVSVPDRVFTLEKDMLDVFRVYTLVAGQKLQVSHIFVQFRGGSFLFPKISLVELHTIDPHSSRLIVERLQP
jgi:hypothetical protein